MMISWLKTWLRVFEASQKTRKKRERKHTHAHLWNLRSSIAWWHRVVVDSWSQLATSRLSGLSNTLEATSCCRHKTIVGIWKRNLPTLTLSLIQVCIFSNTFKFAETKPTDKLWHYRLLYDRVLAALVTLLLQVLFLRLDLTERV